MKKISFMNFKTRFSGLFILFMAGSLLITSCKKSSEDEVVPDNNVTTPTTPTTPTNPNYTISQTISDQAQKNTMAFDALGFMVGNFGAQTFLPPGKVADYSGFQYFRDNDPTNMGHNTSFVTIISDNILSILTAAQIQKFTDAAATQDALIKQYAEMRFPLCMAFRRLINNDLPTGKTKLSLNKVKAQSAALYIIDGQISFNRAKLFGEIITSLSTEQVAKIKALIAKNGIGNWPVLNSTTPYSVALRTYASEMYSWYAGSKDADVYFCPERQGTYFGSFYLKDWPAMQSAMNGTPYTISDQLTAQTGENFYKLLTTDQSKVMTDVVTNQKTALNNIVTVRGKVSDELRKFLTGSSTDIATINTLSTDYGNYDGEIIYLYAVAFSQVYNSMSAAQKTQITGLGTTLQYTAPTGAFMYSAPIASPTVANTDSYFE